MGTSGNRQGEGLFQESPGRLIIEDRIVLDRRFAGQISPEIFLQSLASPEPVSRKSATTSSMPFAALGNAVSSILPGLSGS